MEKPRLLLVDDEERFLSTTKTILEKRGYTTLTASNGYDALSLIAERRLDVVVLDVKMPGIDGVSVLRRIKEQKPRLEVILLTGHASVDSAVDGMKLGAFEYLMKPVDIDVLIERIETAFFRKIASEEQARKSKIDDLISDPWRAFDKD